MRGDWLVVVWHDAQTRRGASTRGELLPLRPEAPASTLRDYRRSARRGWNRSGSQDEGEA